MEELNKEQVAPKKKKAPKKKPVKVFIEKSVKEERGKSLNTSSCSRLNKIKMDLNLIIRTL
jgi:hypothetical protein